jgi:hypothetical protein
MTFAFIGALGYLGYVLSSERLAWSAEEQDLKDEALKYSGIDPGEFNAFAEAMAESEAVIDEDPRLAARKLYDALDHFENLGTHNNYDVQEDVHDVAVRMGIAMERKILESALKSNINWTPRYLNNTLN